MKKPVRSSNLALRFYKGDGWTFEDLEPYLIAGHIEDTQHMHMDDPSWAYYRLGVHSQLNMKRLYHEQVSEVFRRFDDNPSMTDLEFMESFNWS